MSKLKVLDLFSGIGGFSLGLERTGGFETVAFCEIEEYPRKVLAKHWPDVPAYKDVRLLNGEEITAKHGRIDVITGGFPCQDVSIQGELAGTGEGTRSSLYGEIVRISGELRPEYIVMENVTNLLAGPSEQPGGWFGGVLAALAQIGYDAEWHCVSAAHIGAPHDRDRVWIIAYPKRPGLQRPIAEQRSFVSEKEAFPFNCDTNARDWSDMVGGVAKIRSGDGLPVKLERDRIKSAGNAVVPQIPEMIGHAILEAESQMYDSSLHEAR